jgi:hypothetical protein
MENTIPDLNIDSENIYTSNKDVCISKTYTEEEYKKRYSVVFSYEELAKYLPNDQVLHDTARYILDYFKKSTYVSFVNGKLKHFLFLNKKGFIAPYQNKIKINPRNKIPTDVKIRLTQCLVRFNYAKREFKEIDFYVMELLYFLKQLEKKRSVPDCNFFINHKDQVLIHKIGNTYYNPFVDAFGKVPLEDEWQKCKLGRLFSFCKIKDYQDFAFVNPDDIKRIFKLFTAEDKKCVNVYDHTKLDIKWDDKIPTAFWRGTSTGCGNDIYNNPRIRLAYLTNKWQEGDKESRHSPALLNAQIVKWAFKLKKTEKQEMFDRINLKRLKSQGVDLGNKVPIEELYKYKYVINVDGNVAAYRLGFLLSLNSVVLIVEGKYKLWFQDHLIENKHYVSVKSDLSNLKEKIMWCRNHDDECKEIAQNALELHNKLFNENNLYDYIIEMMNKMNQKYS